MTATTGDAIASAQREPTPFSHQHADSMTMMADADTDADTVRCPAEPRLPKWQYLNNLLPAVGYLDLANAMDFPANVWNANPLPTVAIVLMALGGSAAILTTAFAFWDMHRSRKNVHLLHEERAYLKARARESGKGFTRMERAWLDISFREIGWEYIDRILMDASMATAGILVGTGCLLAIRGAVPIIFHTSNILSGYLGNGFVAFYAVVNTPWSVFMWLRGHRHHVAARNVKHALSPEVCKRMKLHGNRHQIYAFVNGLTLIVSGVGSLLSSQHWYGYVILAPCVIGSIFCNHYWRYCLGYNRYSFMDRSSIEDFDIAERLSLVIAIRSAFVAGQADTTDFFAMISTNCKTIPEKRNAVANFMHDYALSRKFASQLWLIGSADGESESSHEVEMDKTTFERSFTDLEATNSTVRDAGVRPFRDEERFLLELFGCFLCQPEDDSSTTMPGQPLQGTEEKKTSKETFDPPNSTVGETPANEERG